MAHPQLKTESGAVADRLVSALADHSAIEEWKKLVAMQITAESDWDD